jgi:transposase-like protein
MKSVFKRIEKQNPFLSSLVVFNLSIIEYRYPKDIINKFFDELVDRKDYARKDRDEILNHCYSLAQ